MFRDRPHGIVADSCGDGEAHPCWVGKKGVKIPLASVVQINVYSSIGVEDEVSDGVGALDGKWVVVKGLQEPRVLFCYKLARFLIGPEL